jgi:hypothetical protein
MHLLRRGFYLMLGLTFPGFWVLHASGFWAVLYQPLQFLFHTREVGWTSLVTATLLYLWGIFCFEWLRSRLNALNRE